MCIVAKDGKYLNVHWRGSVKWTVYIHAMEYCAALRKDQEAYYADMEMMPPKYIKLKKEKRRMSDVEK